MIFNFTSDSKVSHMLGQRVSMKALIGGNVKITTENGSSWWETEVESLNIVNGSVIINTDRSQYMFTLEKGDMVSIGAP